MLRTGRSHARLQGLMPRDARPETPGVAYGAMSCRSRSDNRPRPNPRRPANVAEPGERAFERVSHDSAPEIRKASHLCVASRQPAICAARPLHGHPQRSPRCTTAGADGLHSCAVDPAASHMGSAPDQRKPARDTRHRERAAALRPGRRPQSAIDAQAATLLWCAGGRDWATKAAPSPFQHSAGGHVAGACRAFGKHGPPPLPSPLCTAILRADHRAARPLGGLDGEDRRIGQKKEGPRPLSSAHLANGQ